MQEKITEYSLLGNDIVDLSHPDATSIHSRFSERICTDAEYEQLRGFPKNSQDWLIRLWTYWSIKEAAYKAVKGFDTGLKFRWKDFDTAAEPGKVHCPYDFELSVETTPLFTCSCLHTIVYNSNILRTSIHAQVDVISSDKYNVSDEIRQLFVSNIHEKFNFNYDQVNWNRHKSGAPICSVNKKDLPFDISFSHHGRYMGYVLVVAGSK